MKKDRLEILVSIFVLLIVSGVIYFLVQNYSKGETTDSNIKYETISVNSNIKLGISEYDDINPYTTKNKYILYLDQLIYEPLLTISSDYNIENCLANEISKIDSKVYIIKLKEDVMWSDGTSLSSKDIDFSINELKQNNDSPYYENVKDIEKVELIDAHTIRIELNKEIPFFEYNLIFPIICVNQEENNIPIGTGRYKINQIDNNKIEICLNENYREISKEYKNTITVYLYNSMGELYNAFKNEDIDLIYTQNTNIEEYIGSIGYEKKEYPGREYDYIAFNLENSILKNIEVRQAILLGLQPEKIVNSVLESKAYTAYFPLEENNYLIGNTTNFQYEENTEKAKKVLDSAGWDYENGDWKKEINGKIERLNIKLSVNSNNKQRIDVAKEIAMQLKEIGINIVVEEVSEAQYKNYLENHNYEILLTGIYSSLSPDLTYFFGDGNLANYKNDEISSILSELKNIKDKKLIKQKYSKIIELYNKDIPYIGLYRNKNLIAYSSNLRGEITPNNYGIYYNINEWYIQN